MTVVAWSLTRGGLLFPLPSSSSYSVGAQTLDTSVYEAWKGLAESLAVSRTAETAIRELRRVRQEASTANWDGYGARPLDQRAYDQALRFIQALPTTTPIPDVSADPDGEVDVMWHFDPKKTFSVSIGPNGRLTYSGLFGDCQTYGTEWLSNEIPQPILLNLARVVENAAC